MELRAPRRAVVRLALLLAAMAGGCHDDRRPPIASPPDEAIGAVEDLSVISVVEDQLPPPDMVVLRPVIVRIEPEGTALVGNNITITGLHFAPSGQMSRVHFDSTLVDAPGTPTQIQVTVPKVVAKGVDKVVMIRVQVGEQISEPVSYLISG